MTWIFTFKAPPSPPSPSPAAAERARPAASLPPCGCGLLQAVRGQLTSNRFITTGGEWLDVIFTHREVFNAYPQGHRECAVGFTDLASFLESREWRADRDSDAEAIAAFRHEAWVIASAAAW